MTPAIVKRRPAESSALAGAAAVLVARLLGIVDAETVVALAVVIGGIPALVTWAVSLRRQR